MTPFLLRRAVRALRQGGVIAYPTEAVYGLGCNPDDGAAVTRLLALKGRSAGKGLILVAAGFDQLRPYLAPLDDARLAPALAGWPGPYTWLIPAAAAVPPWLRGGHATLAVRVTAHPVTAALCRAFGGPLVSTSANPAGRPPARSALAVRRYFRGRLDRILTAPLGGQRRPSTITDLISGRVLRRG